MAFDFVDLHCDTLMGCVKGTPLAENAMHIDIKKLRQGGALAQFFAIFIPTGECAVRNNVTCSPYRYFQDAYEAFLREMDLNKAHIMPAACYGDIVKNKDKGLMSALLTIEDGGAMMDGKMERLEEAWRKGVRLVTLTWFYENCLGYPASADLPQHMGKGLKPLGIEVVRRMNELGMIVDVSHLSDGGFWDVVKYSGKPFAASHSSCRALCGHPRNLTDEMLKAVGDKGGIVGVNFCGNFLVEGGTGRVSAEDAVRHLRHMADVAGADTPAFGSDFDGIDDDLEWKDYSGMPLMVEAMEKHGFTSGEIEKICRGNALRFIRDTLG